MNTYNCASILSTLHMPCNPTARAAPIRIRLTTNQIKLQQLRHEAELNIHLHLPPRTSPYTRPSLRMTKLYTNLPFQLSSQSVSLQSFRTRLQLESNADSKSLSSVTLLLTRPYRIFGEHKILLRVSVAMDPLPTSVQTWLLLCKNSGS